MVQRKVPSKLGIQADHIKSNKQTVNLKPYSLPSQNHDIIVKNKGADLKKKMMKKSGKNKLSEYESSSHFRRHVAQPGKPPPTKQQSSPSIRGSTSTPNYMKSTSSSVARKELSQVSSSPIRKSSNNSKLGSASSANKPARSLALTKSPSFKPVKRKSCPPVVLCENLYVERATCSSTLKEAKFPSYLEISPGGTESHGTSVFKVCPYTYCSLNGHHHPPLPPLKTFLSARRRTVKNQRNFKLGQANSHGSVPNQKLNAGEVPLINEDEFFVEIYSKGKEVMADSDGRNTKSDDDGGSEVETKQCYAQVEESLSNGPQHSLGRKREGNSAEIDISGFYPADLNESEVYMPPLVQEEVDIELLSIHNELELNSEASDMDWDEDKYYAYIEDKVDDSVVSEEFMEKSSEESFDKESIISETSCGYDDSQSISSHTDFECVEVPDPRIYPKLSGGAGIEDTSYSPQDGEITDKPENESSTSSEEGITIQVDDAVSLVGYQELIVCNFNEVQDETCEGNIRSHEPADENIDVKMEDGENSSDVIVDATVEVNQVKDAPQFKDLKAQAEYDMSIAESYRNLRGIARCNDNKDPKESGEFNPRPPNFLPVEADPEAEKVDLKHQMMDDKKNAEDWMLDFALRQAVDKLAPARKRKVALLVEAFETVIPTPKWEPHHRRGAAQFAHPRPIQACN